MYMYLIHFIHFGLGINQELCDLMSSSLGCMIQCCLPILEAVYFTGRGQNRYLYIGGKDEV